MNNAITSRSSIFYKLGELGGIPLYIDSSKMWDDKEIICGKKSSFDYNYEIDKTVVSNSHSMAPKMISQLNYQIVINKNNFVNLHYVNEYNDKYVMINRDRKIDEIL